MTLKKDYFDCLDENRPQKLNLLAPQHHFKFYRATQPDEIFFKKINKFTSFDNTQV